MCIYTFYCVFVESTNVFTDDSCSELRSKLVGNLNDGANEHCMCNACEIAVFKRVFVDTGVTAVGQAKDQFPNIKTAIAFLNEMKELQAAAQPFIAEVKFSRGVHDLAGNAIGLNLEIDLHLSGDGGSENVILEVPAVGWSLAEGNKVRDTFDRCKS